METVKGFRIGALGKYQRRHYLYLDGNGTIEFSLDSSVATLFSPAETIEVLTRLLEEPARDYFITAQSVSIFGFSELEKQAP